MAIDLEEFQRLKKKAKDAESARERAAGVLSEQMRLLKTEYGVETIEAAERLEKDLSVQEQDAEEKYNQALKEFNQKWNGKSL